MRIRQFLCVATVLFSAALIGPQTASAGTQVRIGGTGASLEYSRVMARLYGAQATNARIVVQEGLGSSGSIRAVASGALDVAISGRPLKAKEADRGLVATPLMMTPFGFFTSRSAPISVNSRDLPAIYANSGENCPQFGGETVRIVLRPDSDSDLALAASYFPGLAETMNQARHRSGVPIAQADQDNAKVAEEMPNSLTTGTLLQMKSERRNLRAVLIDGAEPSLEAVRSGAYGYSKTIWLVHRQDAAAEVRQFAEYLYSNEAAEAAVQMGAEVIR